MVDIGAEVNLLSRSLVEKAGLTILTEVLVVLRGVIREPFEFYGLCESIEVNIGNLVNRSYFFVVEQGNHQALLGMPFIRKVELIFDYSNGSYIVEFKNEKRTKIRRVRVRKSVEVARVLDSDSENE